jgi:hypothetical protein
MATDNAAVYAHVKQPSQAAIERRAAHVLDEVIMTLGVLRDKTKAEAVRKDLARCIATCERVQVDFAGYVELVAAIDRHLEAPQPGREALKAALGVEGEATNEELCAAAATVIRYAEGQGQEVPQ